MQQCSKMPHILCYHGDMKVHGPYFDKSNQVWRIRWKDPDTGKTCSKSSRQKKVIEEIKLELQGPVEPAQVVDVPPYDQTSSWWDKRCGELAEQLLQSLGSGDEAKVETACRAARAWAGLATAANRFVDQTDIENQVKELEAFVNEIRTARKHGTGTQGNLERIQPPDGSN